MPVAKRTSTHSFREADQLRAHVAGPGSGISGIDVRPEHAQPARDDVLADIALEYVRAYRGHWYRWGGDDPSGFDCSGFAVEFVQSVGRFLHGGDAGAQTLYRTYPVTTAPRRGCLAYWGSGPDGITHVEIVVAVHGDQVITLGASGGGSKVKTVADAIRANAFIKQRPIRAPGRRTDFVGFNDPFLLTVG
ncbi:MAG: C40 family peptidase [Deltaproteobacteria bacterium]|nr:C40 family peptidase [Deltaproteobacteria bacterium]